MTAESPVCIAAWGADNRLYTGHRDGSLRRHDETGHTSRVQAHTGEIVALAADELGVVSAGADRRFLRWDSDLNPAGELSVPNRDDVTVRVVALSPSRVAALLAPRLAPTVLAMWTRVDGKGVFARRISDAFGTGLVFAPDGSFVAATTSDDQITIVRDGAETRIPGRSEGPENFLQALAVPDPDTVLCASWYRWIRRIDVMSGRTTHKLEYRSPGQNVLVRAIEDRVLVVTSSGSFAEWSLESRELLDEYELPLAKWTAVAANPSATRVFAATDDSAVIVSRT